MQQQADNKPQLTDNYVQMWVNQLEQWTSVFYGNATGPQNNPVIWQEAQKNLVQFQKVQNPLELCTAIIEKTKNSFVLYQAVSCLKNSIVTDLKKYDQEELLRLFQFLYDFLCSQALENDTSVNETTALICAMILRRLASDREKFKPNCPVPAGSVVDKEANRVAIVISTLCNNIKDPNENISKKVASSLMLSSLLLECQMSHRSTSPGLRTYRHISARILIETHLKAIVEACLETINWAFVSNLLNPLNRTRETEIMFYLTGSLLQCVGYSLSFNSTDFSQYSITPLSSVHEYSQVLRFLQGRAITMAPHSGERTQRQKNLLEWCDLVMSPSVVQFLFNLYTTIRSMINCVPGWMWPDTTLKTCLNCLYALSDIHNTMSVSRDDLYNEFIGNLVLGAVKIMESDTKGIDDSFQTASLITSISLNSGGAIGFIERVDPERLSTFLDSAQRFTCKVFTQVAKSTSSDEEEEEEKTVDVLLEFWYFLLNNIDSHTKIPYSDESQKPPIVSSEKMKAYARVVVENYISCHLHQPLGQVVHKPDYNLHEVDLDQAEDLDDNFVHGHQLISLGMIARFDATHTANLLIDLLSNRIAHLEALLTQYITTKQSPDGIQDWEKINDDIHWLLLILQHFLTQTSYGERGFMCNEILNASVVAAANTEKTVKAFEEFDYSQPDTDPIVRLLIIVLKICRIEMGVCQSGNTSWLSVQTNVTLTGSLLQFCLSYLYPKESDYTVISPSMNYCFGRDSQTAEKFLQFTVEHACCIIMYMKDDPNVVKKNVQFLIKLIKIHSNVREIISKADNSGMIKAFTSQLKPDNLTGFSPCVAKSIMKLATKLFVHEDWERLVALFNDRWHSLAAKFTENTTTPEIVANQFIEFCDFAMGVCEACDDVNSETLYEHLLVPITEALPELMRYLGSVESIQVAIFELLYYIVKFPMLTISLWECQSTTDFYDNCKSIIETYSEIALTRKDRGTDQEDCQDIISVLTFCHELMKRDWGNTRAPCDYVIKFAMEKLSAVVKPEYLQFPRIRTMYYRLLVYLVDEDCRLEELSDTLLNTIVASILLAFQSKFDKDVDNHVYTIIQIVCRTIYFEKGKPVSERLAQFMLPVLRALFDTTFNQASFSVTSEGAEMVAPALYSLRCCFLEVYQSLVKDLIDRQDDPYSQSRVRSLFEELENKIQKLTLSRSACREFNSLFVPFLLEVHSYTTVK